MRKKVMAIVFAVLAFSLIAASAATLGGITADPIGADTTVVASCNDGNGVDVHWGAPSYNGSTNAYDVTSFDVVFPDDACDGEPISVTLAQGNGTVIDEVTGTVVGDTASFGSLAINAEALRRVAIVVG